MAMNNFGHGLNGQGRNDHLQNWPSTKLAIYKIGHLQNWPW